MRREVARPREALAAAVVVAGERPLARVRALVPREVGRPREALAAAVVGAGERPLARVRALVPREVARLREALAATLVVAGVWPVAHLHTLVHSEVARAREAVQTVNQSTLKKVRAWTHLEFVNFADTIWGDVGGCGAQISDGRQTALRKGSPQPPRL